MNLLSHDSQDVTYTRLLTELKVRIRTARVGAALAVNRALIELYWSIGHNILVRQSQEGWGARTIDRLAADLRDHFPDMTGLSSRNLKYMRAFAEAFPETGIVQQLVAQCPGDNIIRLIETIKSDEQRLAAVQEWSRLRQLMVRSTVSLSDLIR